MRSGKIEGLGDLQWDIVEHTRGAGVELGYGPVKAFPHFIGVRLASDHTGMESADYVCEDWTDLSFLKDDALDYVFEHPGVYVGVPEVTRVLKEGGRHVFFVQVVKGDDISYELQVSVKEEGVLVVKPAPYRAPKSVCIVRYGAIGDTLQAASILPQLKREGYHVTWLCEPTGHDFLRHDPHIDTFLVNDKDQVPNAWLYDYWAHLATKFDRFINLCESVEGALVLLPGRSDYLWPQKLRHEMCNKNYLEFIAKMAEVPFHAPHFFYASAEEIDFATGYIYGIECRINAERKPLERTVKPYVIMWALAGSSVHKFYPHMDAVLAQIMLKIPEAHVILVGDPACMILEAGWENEPRIHRESGKMSVRDTLALAQQCNLVIGPETGVLNAVAFESSAKVLLLSHSTNENLSKHWVNTEAIEPTQTACFPCHRMHYTRDYCPEDKASGASKCMAELPASVVWDAVERAHSGWKTVQKMMEPA